MIDGRIQWHPAFCAALRIELEADAGMLDFKDEYLLSKKPMQIDMVVMKKKEEVSLQKNIGHIFRKHNLVQYKSPDDYLSINDFYKTYGYACFYQSDTEKEQEIRPEEITITFVCNRYPQKLFQHLTRRRKLSVKRYDEGIYYLEGDFFPMQLVVTHELAKEKNFWMQSLRTDLKAGGEIELLAERYEPHKSSDLYQAVMNAVLRANWTEAEVEKKMCEALRELFAEELRDSADKGKAIGKAIGKAEGKAESILVLLREVGAVPSEISDKILGESDNMTLCRWLKQAARAESIEQFISMM